MQSREHDSPSEGQGSTSVFVSNISFWPPTIGFDLQESGIFMFFLKQDPTHLTSIL